MTACSQTTYKRDGNTFSKETTTKSEVKSEKTIYLWTDSRGNEYPIYITENGSTYINRISKKTGNPYRQYLPKEVSIQICKELNREYKGTTKQ